jgi:hypothetical protein
MSWFKKLFLIATAGMLSLSLAACEPADRTDQPASAPERREPAQPAERPVDRATPAQPGQQPAPGQSGQPADSQTNPGGR